MHFADHHISVLDLQVRDGQVHVAGLQGQAGRERPEHDDSGDLVQVDLLGRLLDLVQDLLSLGLEQVHVPLDLVDKLVDV